MNFQPTEDSVQQHQVPQWFHDAKLGIFIHWGLFSVPAWAPDGADIDKQVAENGWEAMFANNPYAEWYLNSVRYGDTPARRYHQATYGTDFSYDDFAPTFNQAVEKWNPDEWAALFEKVGARYVVLTTKHHDGFLLWNSDSTSPHKSDIYAAQRDLVGELTAAVRRHNLRMGLYYSGGLDWSFNPQPIRNLPDLFTNIVQSPDFVEYVTGHWRELIERYAPSILWNDIGYPAGANVPELFAHFYNTVPESLVNDRWGQKFPTPGEASTDELPQSPPEALGDYTTPEYAFYNAIVEKKWEATRGIGHSFGYNQNEGVDDYLSVEELVRSFVDIVSKNGNLLLNVGPMADGTIPELQRERLLGLGAWLDVNGEAIFATRPWITAEGNTTEGIPVRFTRKDGVLYAILLGTPSGGEVTLEQVSVEAESNVSLLGAPQALAWRSQNDRLTVTLPGLDDSPAHVLRITPATSGA